MSTLPPVTVPRFRWRRGALEPPGIFVERDDVLIMRLRGAMAAGDVVEARIRTLSPSLRVEDIRLSYTVAVAQDVTTFQTTPLFEGFLQGAVVSEVGARAAAQLETLQPGQLYCSLTIGKGSPPLYYEHTVLCQGYVQRYSPIGYPGGAQESPGDGRGRHRLVALFDGVGIGVVGAYFVSTMGSARMQSATCRVTTSALAGNRDVIAELGGVAGGIPAVSLGCNVAHPASTTRIYTVSPSGIAGQTISGGTRFSIPWPQDLVFRQGEFFVIRVGSTLAGDVVDQAVGYVEEWAGASPDA